MTNICNKHLLIKNSKIKMKKLFNNLINKNNNNNNKFNIKANKIKKIIHVYQRKNLFTKITINNMISFKIFKINKLNNNRLIKLIHKNKMNKLATNKIDNNKNNKKPRN